MEVEFGCNPPCSHAPLRLFETILRRDQSQGSATGIEMRRSRITRNIGIIGVVVLRVNRCSFGEADGVDGAKGQTIMKSIEARQTWGAGGRRQN
jgi:hypothetical protein